MDKKTKWFRILKVAHYTCGQFFYLNSDPFEIMNTNIDLETSHYFHAKVD
jgi:hypothetical protein